MKRIYLLALTLTLTLLGACASPPKQTQATQILERHLQIGTRLYQAGQIAEAKAAFKRATLAAELIDDSQHLVDALLAVAASELLLGDFTAAAGSYQRAQREAMSAGLSEANTQARIGLAETTRRRNEIPEAIRLFQSLREQPELTTRQGTEVANGLALCLLAKDSLAAAETLLLPLEPAIGGKPDTLNAATLANLARLRLRQGQVSLAETLAIRALQMDRQLLHPPAIAADHALLRVVMQMSGRPDAAQQHLESANRIFRQTGQPLLSR